MDPRRTMRRLAGESTAGESDTGSWTSANRLRVLFLLVLVLAGGTLLYGSQTGLSTATAADVPRAEPTDGHTVVTESGRAGTIIAYRPDGSLLYYDNTRTKYFDVDPVEGEELTVEYVATDTIHSAGPTCEDPPCAHNVVERANLSTGETAVVYEQYDHRERAGEWHDHVRVNDTHLLVADIADNRVFLTNTETGIVEWSWHAQSDFPVKGGGPYPGDWTHVNDVSLLDDGRIMVSLRNQDQVVFVDPDRGVDEAWTLGSDDEREVLYEQHNPDYIPESNGGPAVVVADSENGRVVEFQRVDGEWRRTWTWSDGRLQWPRDADRLPNGNTLVADSHGKRVVEVDPSGEVVWSVPVTLPYDVERLETGDESTGGESAVELGLSSRSGGGGGDDRNGVLAALSAVVQWVLPHRVFNGVLYVAPAWMRRPEFAAAAVAALTVVAWGGLELRWWLGGQPLGFRSPLYRRE